MATWVEGAMRLEQFNYKIEYRPGKDHQNADFNSRIDGSHDHSGQSSVATQTEVCTVEISYDNGVRDDPSNGGKCVAEVLSSSKGRSDTIKVEV